MQKKLLKTIHTTSWNVWNMCIGLSESFQEINSARKTKMLDSEKHKLNSNIAALKET